MKLTEQQQKFADLYISSGNASESYKQAEYKATGNAAESAASRLLRNVKVIEYIEEKNDTLSSTRIADMQEVKEFWTNTLRSEEIEMRDRIKVSELIGKTNAAFIEQVKLSGEVKSKNPLDGLTTEELKKLAKDG